MKNKLNILCFVLLNFIAAKAKAQVGVGTSTPHVSAELDVTSTTKGFLPPRMTAAQRDAIATPAASDARPTARSGRPLLKPISRIEESANCIDTPSPTTNKQINETTML